MNVYMFKQRYSITAVELLRLADFQQNCCAICQRTLLVDEGKRSPLNVDHDHATRQVRGLLCNTCNTGLGLFQDDPGLLCRALTYLRSNASIASAIIHALPDSPQAVIA
jgi:hypothetical protein